MSHIDPDSDSDEDCFHSHFEHTHEGKICTDCGLVIPELSYEQEWRYYGQNDTRFSSDPSRCHQRKNEERNIFRDVEHLNIPQNIVGKANEMYKKIVSPKIYRGSSRKSIIFACIFNAYKMNNDKRSPEEIANLFGLKRKEMSRGMKTFSDWERKENSSNKDKIEITEDMDESLLRVNLEDDEEEYITPIDLVPSMLLKLGANSKYIEPIKKMYERIKNTSPLLNRSNPQSVAAGLVYFYFRYAEIDMKRKEFSEIAKLSDITIIKVARDISKVLNLPKNVKL